MTKETVTALSVGHHLQLCIHVMRIILQSHNGIIAYTAGRNLGSYGFFVQSYVDSELCS